MSQILNITFDSLPIVDAVGNVLSTTGTVTVDGGEGKVSAPASYIGNFALATGIGVDEDFTLTLNELHHSSPANPNNIAMLGDIGAPYALILQSNGGNNIGFALFNGAVLGIVSWPADLTTSHNYVFKRTGLLYTLEIDGGLPETPTINTLDLVSTSALPGFIFGQPNTGADFLYIGQTILENAAGAPTYTVTYDANGGTGTQVDPSSPYASGATVTVMANSGFTRSGYRFDHWNTQADGGGTTYVKDDTFAIGADTTLYAKWIKQCTITYDANGGVGSVPTDSNEYDAGDTVTVLGNTGGLTKSGQVFLGWNTATSKASGTERLVGSTFSITNNVTLYAEWGKEYNKNAIIVKDYKVYIAKIQHYSYKTTIPGSGATWQTYWAQIGDVYTIGDGLEVDTGVLQAKLGTSLAFDEESNIEVDETQLYHNLLAGLDGGQESPAEYFHLTEAEKEQALAIATNSTLGQVIVGDGLTITPEGVMTVDEPATDHNYLNGLQGGESSPLEYYHLTSAEKTVVENTSGTNTGDQESSDFDHDSLTNTHNLTTDIDHDSITNTHNLTDDIDHNLISGLDGGSASPEEYYHLTQAEHDRVGELAESDTPSFYGVGITSSRDGGLMRKSSLASANLSGASTTIQVNVPATARILGVQLIVDTAVTSGDGGATWDAAFSGGSTASICTGQSFDKDTAVNSLISSVVESETDIVITPDTGTFSGGVVTAVVYYEYFVALTAV